MACANNLRQIGIACLNYHEANGTLPRYRRCPDLTDTADPTTGRKPDVDCNSLTSATTYTGPNEDWWAPYDNRPGSTVCKSIDDGYPRGILWPYIEQDAAIFSCPQGFDIDPSSTTYGRRFQCSYGMNYVTNGPNGRKLPDISSGNGTANVIIVWDHGRTPGCANSKIASPAAQGARATIPRTALGGLPFRGVSGIIPIARPCDDIDERAAHAYLQRFFPEPDPVLPVGRSRRHVSVRGAAGRTAESEHLFR